MKLNIDLSLTEPQGRFVEATTFFVLYGGAAGGGKSYAQNADAYIKAIQYPGIKQLVLRTTFPELKRSLILSSREMFDSRIATYHETDKVWTFANGSRIEYGYCESEGDVQQYQSAEYDIIRFDEGTHFRPYIIEYLRSRVRGANSFPKQIKISTNPGGVGHQWHFDKFINGKEPNRIYVDDTGEDSVFIPAKVDDNIFLMAADPAYKKRLESLPEAERRMLLYGDWNVFDGQFFSEYRPNAHRMEPFNLPENAVLYGSLDHGTTAPTSFGLWWKDADKIPHRLCTYYQGGKSTKENAYAIACMCKAFRWTRGRPPMIVYADPSMWTKSRMEREFAPSHIDYYNDAFAEVFADFTDYKTQFVKAINDIHSGCAIMREHLRVSQDGIPGIYVWDKYNRAFETLIPLQQADRHDSERYDTALEDHIADDTRYALVGMMGSTYGSVMRGGGDGRVSFGKSAYCDLMRSDVSYR